MSTMLIGYDLNQPGQDYENLIQQIQGLGSWWHHLESTWLVKTDLTPANVRDKLKTELDESDELLIIDVTGDARPWTGA